MKAIGKVKMNRMKITKKKMIKQLRKIQEEERKNTIRLDRLYDMIQFELSD